MIRFPRPATLRITFPIGQTLALAVPILLLIAGIAEFIFRLPAVESRLPAPSIGSNHEQFEIQLHLLENFANNGPVDCIFIGSSIVYRGISPKIVTDAYTQQTGKPLRCYTFGISGETASDLAIVAEYVVETYRPQLLVYGISPRDCNKLAVEQNQAASAHKLADLDWIRYWQGSFNLSGWLFEHSKAFGYAHLYRSVTQPNFTELIDGRRKIEAGISAGGYRPIFSEMKWPLDNGEKKRAHLLMYMPVPDELDGVRQIIALYHPPQTQVVLVEVPFYDGVLTELLGQDTYASFNRQIEVFTESTGVLYWPTTLLRLIPDNGWANFNHMNDTGATAFSQWLGERIGQAVNQEQLMFKEH